MLFTSFARCPTASAGPSARAGFGQGRAQFLLVVLALLDQAQLVFLHLALQQRQTPLFIGRRTNQLQVQAFGLQQAVARRQAFIGQRTLTRQFPLEDLALAETRLQDALFTLDMLLRGELTVRCNPTSRDK